MTQTGRRYQIHRRIGRGAFGTVYRATLSSDGGFTREVAVKVLNAKVSRVEGVAERLRDEARLLGLVRHRAILQVDGLTQLNGHWAVVSEFIEGCTLMDIVRKRRMPATAALEVVGELAGALHTAYSAAGPDGSPLRLVHRDIKLTNIQLTPAGEVKLLDFGIATAEFPARESETGTLVIGSPGYMAPERLDMVDGPEGDVYALGVVLYELTSARRFARTSADRVRHEKHLAKRMKTWRREVPDLPELENLLLRLLAWDPAERPTARQLERACNRLRGRIRGPMLSEWAEHHVHPAEPADEDDDRPDDLDGTTLTESTSAIRRRMSLPEAIVAPAANSWVQLAAALVIGSVLGAGSLVIAAAYEDARESAPSSAPVTALASAGDAVAAGAEVVSSVEPPGAGPAAQERVGSTGKTRKGKVPRSIKPKAHAARRGH